MYILICSFFLLFTIISAMLLNGYVFIIGKNNFWYLIPTIFLHSCQNCEQYGINFLCFSITFSKGAAYRDDVNGKITVDKHAEPEDDEDKW